MSLSGSRLSEGILVHHAEGAGFALRTRLLRATTTCVPRGLWVKYPCWTWRPWTLHLNATLDIGMPGLGAPILPRHLTLRYGTTFGDKMII